MLLDFLNGKIDNARATVNKEIIRWSKPEDVPHAYRRQAPAVEVGPLRQIAMLPGVLEDPETIPIAQDILKIDTQSVNVPVPRIEALIKIVEKHAPVNPKGKKGDKVNA